MVKEAKKATTNFLNDIWEVLVLIASGVGSVYLIQDATNVSVSGIEFPITKFLGAVLLANSFVAIYNLVKLFNKSKEK